MIRHHVHTLQNAIEPGVEIFAIGDTHGQEVLLDRALEIIAAQDRLALTRRLIHIGDVIDRGHASLRSVDLMLGASARLGCAVISLMGNHEQMARLAWESGLRDDVPRWWEEDGVRAWLENGGRTVLAELGPDAPEYLPTRAALLGTDFWDWIYGLQQYHVSGDVIFVHAGIDPSRPLYECLDERWDSWADESHLWVRKPFLDAPQQDGGRVTVVHGHTPARRDQAADRDAILRGRLPLDIGAYGHDAMIRVARIVGRDLDLWDVGHGD